MELRQLEYFVAVARHRHFTRAAEELYVTQPALSQQIRRLEAELGIALFSRMPAGVELTAAGSDLLARADAILAEVARARSELNEHAGVERGIVRVVAPAADAIGLPQALADFHRDHPGLRLTLRQTSPQEAVALIQRGGADLAVVSLPAGADEAGLAVEPLADEPLRAIVAADDPLASGDSGGSIDLWDLRDRPWILPERGSGVYEAITAACQERGFSPVPQFEVGDPGTVRFLVHAGLGVSAVPGPWLATPGAEVKALVLPDPAPRHRVSLVAPAAGLSPAAALLHQRLSA